MHFRLIVLAAVAALALPALAQEQPRPRTQPQPEKMQQQMQKMHMGMMNADTVIKEWPQKPQESARMLITKYGQPQEVTPTHLVWFQKGPFARIVAYKATIRHDFPKPHNDSVQHFVALKVPPEKISEIAKFDGSIIVERTLGEVSARCDREEMNLLALNLAKDIVDGKKSVEDARRDFANMSNQFMQGQKPEYTQKLKFETRGDTADPDQPVDARTGQ